MELGERTLDLDVKVPKKSKYLVTDIDPHLSDHEIRKEVLLHRAGTTGWYVGIGDNPQYPRIISGPFEPKGVRLLPGHSFWVRVEDGSVRDRWVLIHMTPHYL